MRVDQYRASPKLHRPLGFAMFCSTVAYRAFHGSRRIDSSPALIAVTSVYAAQFVT